MKETNSTAKDNWFTWTMPAEWEEHEGTLIAWPVRGAMVWPDNYEENCLGYAEVIKAIARFEKVTVLINSGDESYVNSLCQGENIELVHIPHNDAWARDNGPTILWNEIGGRVGVSWEFNAWGGKYSPWDLDNGVAPTVLSHWGLETLMVPLVMEGGSIHVDGEGTLLTTKECLLNTNRNPHMAQRDIEGMIKRILNVDKFIWLNRGLYGDETDGHIDNIACFAKPGVILLQTCHDSSDPNYAITLENLEILRESTDARGRKLEIIEIPQPPVRYYEGERLTLSYLNFYFVNQGIILPIFGDDAKETDEKAISILQELYPEREIVTVDGMRLIKEGGNVHCICQQFPKAYVQSEDKQ